MQGATGKKKKGLAHEKRDLMVFWFVVPQMRMRSPLFGVQTCIFASSFHKVSTTCLRTAKAQARLHLCAGSPEPLLVAYVISTFFSCAGSNVPSDMCPSKTQISMCICIMDQPGHLLELIRLC